MDFDQNLFQYRVIHINIRGVRSNKRNLEELLGNNNYPEIVTLNETKLGRRVQFELPGYYCASRREPTDLGGKHGSMILVRDDIDEVVELDFLQTQFQPEVIGIEILRKDRRPSLNVITYYIPPGKAADPAIFRQDLYRGKRTILTGDLNCKHTAWGSNSTDLQGIELLNTLHDQNWTFLNDGSKTRYDPRNGKEEVLDIIACSRDVLRYGPEFEVLEEVGSDHYPIITTMVFDRHQPKNPIFSRKVSQIDETRFKEIINEKIMSLPRLFQTASDLDDMAAQLPVIVKEAYEQSCPLRRVHFNKRPMNGGILELIKTKRDIRRKKGAALKRGDLLETQRLQREMNLVGAQIKKEQTLEEKKRHNDMCARLNDEKNPKKYFQSIRKLTGHGEKPKSSRTKKIKFESGHIASSAQERVNFFADRLERVHQTPEFVGFDDGWKISVERYIAQNNASFTTNPIAKYLEPENGDTSPLVSSPSVEEILQHLRRCKTKSAAGLDGIGYDLLKKVPDSFWTFISEFFGACLRVGYFPKEWKQAKTIMLPKFGKDLSLAKNYRPISLLSCIGKLFERLLAGRLSHYLESNGYFNKNQSGYRRGKMSSDHLLRLVEESHQGFRDGETTAALFLDAEAAFDKCWHDGVRYKLREYFNIPERTIRILSSFLSDRTLQVFEMGLSSRVINLRAGTPQGSCLSPLIYIIAVNDLPTGDKHGISQFQFADDIALRSTDKSGLRAVSRLQKAVNDVEVWCRKWRMKLNGDKSNLVIISRGGQIEDENLCILLFNDVVRPVSKAKFLGLEIDESLSFKGHIQECVEKAHKRLNILRILARGGTDPVNLIRLYKTYIRSVFEYGCISFLHAPILTLRPLQVVQNMALRICLNLPTYISTDRLHEYACLPKVGDRLNEVGSGLLGRMKVRNGLIAGIIEQKERKNFNHIIGKKGLCPFRRSHRSPLDILLPAQRPVL